MIKGIQLTWLSRSDLKDMRAELRKRGDEFRREFERNASLKLGRVGRGQYSGEDARWEDPSVRYTSLSYGGVSYSFYFRPVSLDPHAGVILLCVRHSLSSLEGQRVE